jgi:hypothetical protein
MQRTLTAGLLLLLSGCCGYGLTQGPGMTSKEFETPEAIFSEYYNAMSVKDFDRVLPCLEISDRGSFSRIFGLMREHESVSIATGDCIESKYGAALASRWRSEFIRSSTELAWQEMKRNGAKVVLVGENEAVVVSQEGKEISARAKTAGSGSPWYLVLDHTCSQLRSAIEIHRIVLKRAQAMEEEIRSGKIGAQEIEGMLD